MSHGIFLCSCLMVNSHLLFKITLTLSLDLNVFLLFQHYIGNFATIPFLQIKVKFNQKRGLINRDRVD